MTTISLSAFSGRLANCVAAQTAVQDQAFVAWEKSLLTALEDVENAMAAYANGRDRVDARSRAASAASSTTIPRGTTISGVSSVLGVAISRGAANATFMTAFDLGICIGIVAIGHVQKVLGWEASHAVEIACFIIGAALFWGMCLPHYTRTLKALREREVQAQQTQ